MILNQLKAQASSYATTLNLNNKKYLTSEDWVTIFDFLRKNSKFTALNFAETILEDYSVEHLAHFLSENPAIQSLNLSYTHLTDAQLRKICYSLNKNTKLEILLLKNNKITDNGMRLINPICSNKK